VGEPTVTSGEPDKAIDSLTNPSVELTRVLIAAAETKRTSHERANRKRFARMVTHSSASKFTMMLTDRVIRINSNRDAAGAFADVGRLASAPGLGTLDFSLVKAAILASKVSPNFVMRCVRWRVRKAAVGIILPAEPEYLASHVEARNNSKIKLNINVLGEAILGEQEAGDRLQSVLEMMQRPEVDYVSVKISALVSQINALDHLGSIERVTIPLREIYRSSIRNETFVNLDMEEFKDLKLTVDVFTKLLDEPELENLSAGIVLQAYLPDSHTQMQHLIEWAKQRFERTGAAIKIRIVKGANLAQELTDAQLHGWQVATYESKAVVDASYLRMLDLLLRPENSAAVRVGIASHNLFHLAWAICVARQRDVEHQIDIEMLEGMANSEALAITETFGTVLLYAPVTYQSDFSSAVAYLVRRLDENTSAENYLSASFNISTSGPAFESQMEKFVQAVSARHLVSTQSRRHQFMEIDRNGGFENASDSDPTSPDFQQEVRAALQKVVSRPDFQIPLGINALSESTDVEIGIDPNANGAQWYTYNVATTADVDCAVSAAVASLGEWEARGALQRAHLLRNAARLISNRRPELIALMARDGAKPLMEADAEISEAIDFANYYADQATKLDDVSQPLGPVLVIPPWNFPLAIPLGGVCASLAAGNTVILKPAPETVATAKALVDILWQAGIPSDVLQFLPCRDDEIGKYLVTHEGISAVILTGAFETAKMFKSWRPDLNLLAETSGKNSILITASADIDSAVKDLVSSAFGHAGQKCSAASLAIIDEALYSNHTFLSQLLDATQSLAFGASTNIGTTNGPLIRPPEPSLLRALTKLDPGESWLLEPTKLDDAGFLWSAGIKLGVKPGSWSHLNEWFGPVLALMSSVNLAQALVLQNSTSFGLTAGISSLDENECNYWAANVEAGNLYINRGITGAVVSRQPFGGWKQSSVGPTAKAGGPHYLEQLRTWSPLLDLKDFKESAESWMSSIGTVISSTSEIAAELNYSRYRPYSTGILVRVDERTDLKSIALLEWLRANFDLNIFISRGGSIHEVFDQLAVQHDRIEKVRWLSSEEVPELALLELGISIDKREIADSAAVEMPRWLREQSISITNHRYGNIGAAPQVTLH